MLRILYATAGTYTVKISGDFPAIYFNNAGDKDKIQSIDQWGDIEWSDMANAFYGCTNLGYTATDAPDLSNVTSLANTFANATSFNGDISNWDVSSITNMSSTFSGAEAFNQAIGNWDVSQVTDMSSLFTLAKAFNQDINNWDVSNVTNMLATFFDAKAFNQDIGDWNVSNVSNMLVMFTGAERFDQNLGDWDVSKVPDMFLMFAGTSLSTENYDSLLIGWSQLPLRSNVRLEGGSSYCKGANARQQLIDNFNWSIVDGDLDCFSNRFYHDLASDYSRRVHHHPYQSGLTYNY